MPRFTITSQGDRIYARLGANGGLRVGASYLVAVDRRADGKLLWRRPSSEVALPHRAGAGAIAWPPSRAAPWPMRGAFTSP